MTLDDLRRTVLAPLLLSAAAVWLGAGDRALEAHGSEARYVEVAPWQRDRIPRVLAVSRSELGTPGTRRTMEVRNVAGRSCLVGALFALDVDDDYAFDIDEPVALTLTYATGLTTPFIVGWDRNGGEGFGVTDELAPEPGAAFASTTLTLDRARFAGRGVRRTDLAVSAREGIALCDVSVERSGATRPPTRFGRLVLDVRDGDGGPEVPARVGLYDATGRAPLPSDRALSIHRFTDEIRLLRVNARTFWPSANRLAFYVDGGYETRVPAGAYELVVTRGPEYRSHRSTIEIRPGETTPVTVPLQRYADLPAGGWVSGDSHVHLMRERPDDDAVWGQIAAEDLYVANLLEMGNIAGTHFRQPAWGLAGRFERDGRVLVSGQEDPRTGQRGHTMHWNIRQPVHEPDAFFEYHEIFENTRGQGGLTGYAHLGELFNGRRGLALDVPFGLVDFIEVLQGGRLNTEIWYTFLNLGYRVLPVAGADFPYFGPTLPGVERTYVRLDGPFSADAWFAAFRAGRAYVSNGPFLELSVNGRQMGEELRVARGAPLAIEASARLNPELDRLERLELVVLGDVAATETADGTDAVALSRRMTAESSVWIAVRAWGERQEPRDMTVAHSAPIYVVVGDEPTWKRAAVPELIAHHRAQLQALLSAPIDPQQDLDRHDAGRAVAAAAHPPRAPRGGGRPALCRPAGTVPALRARGGRKPAVIGAGSSRVLRQDGMTSRRPADHDGPGATTPRAPGSHAHIEPADRSRREAAVASKTSHLFNAGPRRTRRMADRPRPGLWDEAGSMARAAPCVILSGFRRQRRQEPFRNPVFPGGTLSLRGLVRPPGRSRQPGRLPDKAAS